MKFKTLILLLTVVMTLTVSAASQDYMSYFWKYTAAASGGNPAEICSAVDALDAALPSPSNVDEYNKLIWAVQTAAKEYEKAGDFDKALYYYEKFVKYAEWLQQNDSQDHAENIKLTKAVIQHLDLTAQVYAATENPADAVFHGAKHEPLYGVFNGTCDGFYDSRENAHLLYVRFFDENVKDFFYMIPEKPVYLMVAWNVPHENKADLDRINSGSDDEYIISNLKYMSTLPHKVLLRFGAEINCWDMPSDKAQRDKYIESFKSAFRRIADFADKYAPNVAMVYSPNDISNMYVTAEDFYPGDEYVDWVGLSTYSILDSNASFLPADRVDAYYFRGLYDNPVMKIRNIVEAFGDRKPILVSECGFAYAAQDGQTEKHAVEKLRQFYTYVNMVFPQVKGVLYFNADFERKFKLDNAPAVKSAYLETISENLGMQAMLNSTEEGYTRFSTYEGKSDELNIYTYVSYPSAEDIKVSYLLDCKPVKSEATFPYNTVLNTTALADGKHTLTLEVACGEFYKTHDYVFYIENGTLLQNPPAPLPFADITPSDWFYNDVKTAYTNGLINGKGDIYAPNDNMTYAEAVKLAACMHQLYHNKKVTLTNGSPNWYDSYSEYALNNKIISNSISDIADTYITRKEFVRIFHAAFPAQEYTLINTVEDNAIPDVKYTANDTYSPLIYDFYRAGILTGSDGGYFKPESNILRSEVAAILTRMFDKSARKNITLK